MGLRPRGEHAGYSALVITACSLSFNAARDAFVFGPDLGPNMEISAAIEILATFTQRAWLFEN